MHFAPNAAEKIRLESFQKKKDLFYFLSKNIENGGESQSGNMMME